MHETLSLIDKGLISTITHHSVSSSILQFQSVLKSCPNAIPKGVLGVVLETLTSRGGLPNDTPRWTNQLKWGFYCTVIGGKGQKENPLILTALCHFSEPVCEGVSFHLKSDCKDVRNHLSDERGGSSLMTILWWNSSRSVILTYDSDSSGMYTFSSEGATSVKKTPLLLFRRTDSCPIAANMPQCQSEERATPI